MATAFDAATLAKLSQLGPPQTAADIAAVAAVGVASAAYLLRGIVWDRPDPYHHIWFERPQLRNGGAANGPKATRNIAQKMEEAGKDVVIFWGSQSGTAETFANRLAKEAHLRFGLQTLSADLCDYDADTIALIPESKLAVFIVSTFGEGDPSDNTTPFWEWLHKDNAQTRLSHLRYMAFGLGNSSYRHYNRVVDVVVEALDRAGAQRLMPVGKADDAVGGTEEDFLAWKDSLYAVFTDSLGLEERDVPYVPALEVVEDSSMDVADLYLGEPQAQRHGPARVASAYSAIKPLAVRSARELYTAPQRNCLHLELDLADHPELRYRTGDHLAVYPINPDQEVQRLLKAVGLEDRADVPLLIRPVEDGEPVKIPSPTTVAALFRHYLELCAPVSRETVGELARFAPSPQVASFLSALGKDKDAYANYVAKTHVTMGRLLTLAAPDTVWSALPLSYLVETLPHIQPRYYSISSSSAVSARRVAITAGVENTPLAADSTTSIRGVTTNYLLALANSLNQNSPVSLPDTPSYALDGPGAALAGHKLFACIRKSTFKLPPLGTTPLIMIGAGTGLAPFRAFVHERARLHAVGKPVGRMLLFAGCRRPDEDALYRDELASCAAALDGALDILPAYSRADDTPRTYVQDRVAEMRERVCALLMDGACLYICGRAAMAREVGGVVDEAMRAHNGWSDAEMRAWSESAKKGKKWFEDVWG